MAAVGACAARGRPMWPLVKWMAWANFGCTFRMSDGQEVRGKSALLNCMKMEASAFMCERKGA